MRRPCSLVFRLFVENGEAAWTKETQDRNKERKAKRFCGWQYLLVRVEKDSGEGNDQEPGSRRHYEPILLFTNKALQEIQGVWIIEILTKNWILTVSWIRRYNEGMKGALRQAVGFDRVINYLNNRHFAEWRLLLFTVTVMVIQNTWNVIVIGMLLTSFPDMT